MSAKFVATMPKNLVTFFKSFYIFTYRFDVPSKLSPKYDSLIKTRFEEVPAI